ncbi:HupV protein [Rubrivivax gelatinosus]|uniref:nickel-dependent hydrogenase large subunit n=1 Tax=Rubrivivax gelatinosus TaxID=28068 RepID=UPI0019030EC9|nr:nickel-dependent hydrogenase large subunit [Rubrivivax gelatinosus]MBK1615141.1 HupV protein [Rubrivivax gelatinosus]
MSRLIVGPFNRVEGDLEVRLDVADGRVASAEVVSPMYRGFEQMLVGRPAMDALVVVPRICGICSVSQSVAAARALAAAAGVTPPPNGVHTTNLMLGCENAADHLSHFYLFFLPDFTRPAYAGRPWFAEAEARFAALAGSQARRAIAARQRWFELLGTLGGKWPHTQSIQPGGSSRAIEAAERLRLLARVREFRAFLEHELFAAPLEEVLALRDGAALERWRDAAPRHGDFRLWLEIAADLQLHTLGPGPGRLLGYGGFLQPDGGHAFPPGLWENGNVSALDLAAISEDASHAWLADSPDGALHPSRGLTLPDADKAGGYTWNKAPRLAGRVVETGALARQLLAGQPLVADVVARQGCNVATRVLARLVELASLPLLMERALAAIVPREPFHVPTRLPDEGEGCGLTEAARGALGHWVRLERGRIANWQIVAPTSWNFSPRDAAGVPGALEAALVGTPVAPGEKTPVAVQHVVRSFDPCMVCTVH